MNLERREFLALLGAGAASAATPSWAQSVGSPDGLLTGLLQGINQCLKYKIVSTCYDDFVPIGFVVQHYLPTALIEIVKAPFDSVLAPSGSVLNGTRVRKDSMRLEQNAFEARAWAIKDYARGVLTLWLSQCGWCNDRDANNQWSGQLEFGQALKDVSSAACLVTDPAGAAASIMGMAFAGQLPLLYSSEIDFSQWRTGCRDALLTGVTGPATAAICTADAAINGPLPSPVTGPGAEELCVGSWGQLYPRQMYTTGTDELVAACLSAYRAMHLAKYDLKTFRGPVNRRCLLQPVYPGVRECFKVGLSRWFLSAKMPTSVDGRYAFYWWAPVGCCIGFSEVFDCIGASGAQG